MFVNIQTLINLTLLKNFRMLMLQVFVQDHDNASY